MPICDVCKSEVSAVRVLIESALCDFCANLEQAEIEKMRRDRQLLVMDEVLPQPAPVARIPDSD